jgi:hypothetical protein
MNASVPFYACSSGSRVPGWTERALEGAARDRHLALSALKEVLIRQFDEYLQQQRKRDPSLGDLEVEYLKSAVRSILRYSSEARHFARELFKDLAEQEPRYATFYVTPPYLIFHTPGDKLEVGTIHSDTIREGGEMFTCWTPVNAQQLTYPALSFFEGSHTLLPHFAYRIFRKFRINAIAEETLLEFTGVNKLDLVPNRESSYFWDSDLLHIGNENTGGVAHCAMVFRVSQNPLYYEPSAKCSDLITDNFSDIPTPSVGEVAEQIISAAEIARNAPNVIESNDATKKWVDSVYVQRSKHDDRSAKYLSFAFALIAQRFPSHALANAYYLMSFIYGKENLVGIERVLAACAEPRQRDAILEMLGRTESFASVQERILLNKLGVRPSSNLPDIGNSSKLVSWLS